MSTVIFGCRFCGPCGFAEACGGHCSCWRIAGLAKTHWTTSTGQPCRSAHQTGVSVDPRLDPSASDKLRLVLLRRTCGRLVLKGKGSQLVDKFHYVLFNSEQNCFEMDRTISASPG